MNNTTKKIIAREVLVFFGLLFIVGISWCILTARDFYNLRAAANYRAHIEEIDSVSLPIFRPPVDAVADNSNVTGQIYIDSLEQVRFKLYVAEMRKKNNVLYTEGILLVLIYLSGLALLMAYVVRGVYYLLKWAIETLRGHADINQEIIVKEEGQIEVK